MVRSLFITRTTRYQWKRNRLLARIDCSSGKAQRRAIEYHLTEKGKHCVPTCICACICARHKCGWRAQRDPMHGYTGAYESECRVSHVGIVLKCAVIYLYKTVAVTQWHVLTCSLFVKCECIIKRAIWLYFSLFYTHFKGKNLIRIFL